MNREIAVIGVGTTGFRATTPDLSYRELTYEAAKKAYLDAGIEPKEIGAFVATSEDFCEGYSISDEYSPDQVGAVLKPMYTVPGDFIQSMGSGVMMLRSGLYDIVAIQGLSKASNMLTKPYLTDFALDPVYNRPLKEHPDYLAGMEMNRYLYETGTTREQCAQVVVKNKRNAMFNPLAGFGSDLTLDYVLASEMISFPLTELDISPFSDGAVVIVMANAEVAKGLCKKPVWVRGIGWSSDTPGLETRDWGKAIYAKLAGDMAYKMAGIRSPRSDIDFAEINDEFSYKELQHLEALKLCNPGEAGRLTMDGVTEISGSLPINTSGGCIGVGNLMECNGGQRVLDVVLQLRGEAGHNQLENAFTGLAMSWRGLPTTTGAVAILSN
ncbi:MAG: acetyl-CoA acetyltransferase [Desulfobacterales bacterium]|nr:acetyl-CoA acetyltransferase [Desulfobacterales bacterium]